MEAENIEKLPTLANVEDVDKLPETSPEIAPKRKYIMREPRRKKLPRSPLLGTQPIKMTDKTLEMLEYAFSIGAPDEEACAYAGISAATLYNYQKIRPEYAERKEQLKNMPIFQARGNIVNSIKEHAMNPSYWYLERKARAEFGNQPQLNIGINIGDILDKLERPEPREAIEQPKDHDA